MINKAPFLINKAIILSIFFIFSLNLFSCQAQTTNINQQEKKLKRKKETPKR